jgi:hypothetical protein
MKGQTWGPDIYTRETDAVPKLKSREDTPLSVSLFSID